MPPILLSTYYIEGPMASPENAGNPEADPVLGLRTLTGGGGRGHSKPFMTGRTPGLQVHSPSLAILKSKIPKIEGVLSLV